MANSPGEFPSDLNTPAPIPHPLGRESLMARYGGRYRWQVLAVIAVGVMGGILPSSSLVVAIPRLLQEFNLPSGDGQLVMTAFLAANTTAMLPASWLIERYGVRKCFNGTMALLLLTSVVGFFCPNFETLMIVRVLQGAGTGTLAPMSSVVVMRLFSQKEQGKASGLTSMAVTLAPALAPTIGGVLVDHFGWRSVSLMPLPFCIAGWLMALRFLPVKLEESQHFDKRGMVLLTVMTGAWLGAVSSLTARGPMRWYLVAWVLLVALSFLAFVQHSRRHHSPLISLDIVNRRRVLMGVIVGFVLGMTVYGSSFIVPLYFQTGMHLSATRSGASLMPGTLALTVSFSAAGFLLEVYRPRKLIIAGLLTFAIAWLVLGEFGEWLGYGWFIVVFMVSRVGHGFAVTPLTQASLSGLKANALAQAASVLSYTRQMGGIFGIAAFAAFAQWRAAAQGDAGDAMLRAYGQTFTVAALLTLLTVWAAWRQGR
jgi:EmrB/QacA subfamily drug resistance transporter